MTTRSNLEMQDLFKDAFKKLNSLKKEGDYFKAFILAFSILEDRITAAYKMHIVIMGLNIKREQIPFSVIAKAKILFLSRWLHKKDYDSLCKIAGKRNLFYHKYFMADVQISQKVVEDIIRLVRIVDKKIKGEKRKLK